MIADVEFDVEFVRSCRMNESEHVVSGKTLAVAVDNEEVLNDVVKVAKVLRSGLLNHRDTWHFTGSIYYENPSMVAFFLKHLLFGK